VVVDNLLLDGSSLAAASGAVTISAPTDIVLAPGSGSLSATGASPAILCSTVTV
jgi:hypothetical protein